MARIGRRSSSTSPLADACGPAAWVVLVIGACSTLVLPGPSEGTPVRLALLVTLTAFFSLLVGRLVLTAAAHPARRLPLALLAGSVTLWAVGSATVSAGQAVTAVTFPAPGEILCLAAYLGLAAFLLLDVPRRAAPTAAVWLEAGVVCGGAGCLAAFAVLTPLSGSFPSGGLPLLVAVLFPLINLMLCATVLGQMLLRQRDRSSRSVGLMLGFLGLAVADSSFIVRLSDQAYTPNLAIEALWGCSFGIIVGAACAKPSPAAAPPADRQHSVLLAVAGALALVVLVLNPTGLVGGMIKALAVVTLVCGGGRLVVALREARGAAEAMRLSLTDELTGLPNRRALMAATDTALQRRLPIGVLLLDLDGFKDINDGLGHSVGDEVLVTLGHRMRAGLEPKVTVARLGGDEFALLVPGDDEVQLLETAHHVRSLLRDPLRVDTFDVSIDAAVGITVRLEGDTSSTELLRRADIAMYHAKAARCGALLFDASQDGASRHRLRRGEDLRHAIARGELEAWYQPQVDARTGQVVAVEALVRWRHPTEGMLSPIAFLSEARAAGLMPAVTEAMVGRVVTDARRWAEAGFSFRVAMNWAPPELVGGVLLPTLFRALEAARLPPDSLLVEVTEDSFLAEPDRAREALIELRRHGVQVAIDDYGSGFSSLSYLRDLPVQELKMDRSFVGSVADDERSRMIVQTTTQMAHALGLRLVAEGVEDAGAVAELLPMGVDVLQGYHIARPMPADEVGPWVRWWARHGVTPAAGRQAR